MKNETSKRRTVRGTDYRLGVFEKNVDDRLAAWHESGWARRLWAKNPTLWASADTPEITNRLGWLDLPATMPSAVEDITSFAAEVRAEGIERAVVLGMGGSSLAPDVFSRIFPKRSGFPSLTVLDSTHPAAVAALARSLDLARTLFFVSSKSGTTVEPLSFFRFFWDKLRGITNAPGRHFAAITDPGTPLVALGRERDFRRVFLAPPDVGGRFSALTPFGLVPAAVMGIDIGALLAGAEAEATANGPDTAEARAPGLRLGAALGELGAVRDKVTFVPSASLSSFPDWLEQLVAESLGKTGKGILPVATEPRVPAAYYGEDRLFVALVLESDADRDMESFLAAVEKDGQPVIRFKVAGRDDIGAEMFRWETAIAAAGAVLGVHPFNQPDVELAKELARRSMSQDQSGEKPPPGSGEEVSADDSSVLGEALEAWLAQSRSQDYLALQAYLKPDAETAGALQAVREDLLKKSRLATTLGFGPRFLHSTGQFHKGGPNRGLFLQLVDEPETDLPVPETDYTFGRLIRAQYLGDEQALRRKGRRVLRVNLGRDVAGGLERTRRALRR
jgi:transaldolase/glucose-6-phosphate isomerase